MASAPTCATCRFWTFRRGSGHACHRNPPVVIDSAIGWPPTSPHEWCGEHRPKTKQIGTYHASGPQAGLVYAEEFDDFSPRSIVGGY